MERTNFSPTTHPMVFRIGQLGSSALAEGQTVATCFAALDAALPGGGWPKPGLSEIFSNHVGIGELSLLLKGACTGSPRTLWVLPPNQPWIPYAPGLVARGIDLANLAIVRPKKQAEALWAAEQALKSGACQTVILWLSEAYCNPLSLRRLLQSATVGKSIGFLIRPMAAAATPSPAGLRIALHPQGNGSLRLDLLKRRGLPPDKSITLSVQDLPCLSRVPMPLIATIESKEAAPWLTELLAGNNTISNLVRERSLIADR